jgi:hypothetical protein
MPDSSVDLIVTSPPYNLKNSTGNGMKDGRGGKWANAALQKGYSHYNDNMPHKEIGNRYSAYHECCVVKRVSFGTDTRISGMDKGEYQRWHTRYLCKDSQNKGCRF